jgi:hypothetical protein
MITLKQWMEVSQYKISEGSEYGWECYGADAHRLDAWNGDHNGVNTSIVFDTKDQTVYETTVYDYGKNRAYRLINPAYLKKYKKESKRRKVKWNNAWDDVNYIDLDVDKDWLEKAQAIMSGEEYDERVQVPLILENDQLFELMKQAHERDITLNELVEDVLKQVIKGELIEN